MKNKYPSSMSIIIPHGNGGLPAKVTLRGAWLVVEKRSEVKNWTAVTKISSGAAGVRCVVMLLAMMLCLCCLEIVNLEWEKCDLSAHRHTHPIAPQADLIVAQAVDGAVLTFGERGRMGGGVGVAWRGVCGGQCPAAAAIHLDFTLVEEVAVALPAPADA